MGNRQCQSDPVNLILFIYCEHAVCFPTLVLAIFKGPRTRNDFVS